jgi:uncharacterized protein YjiK
MNKFTLTLAVSVFSLTLSAQPLKLPTYSVDNIQLPADLDKQVCISGMKMYKGQLYFASERCPFIVVFDPATKQIARTINLHVPQEYEMEGMTSYHDKLYLISENRSAIYEVNMKDGSLVEVNTSSKLPEKLKSGDGMEGIAANEKSNKFYLLRERNEDLSKSQIFTFNIIQGKEGIQELVYESMIELPLESAQWRYSDICVDVKNSRLICLKSFSKGKLRQQYLETVSIDVNGVLQPETLTNLDVENFSGISNQYKAQDYSMNLEGVTIADDGTIYIVSDNTSGKAMCDMPAKEKTVLLELKKN